MSLEREFLEKLPDGWVLFQRDQTTDGGFVCTDSNEAYLRLQGEEKQAIVGKKLTDFPPSYGPLQLDFQALLEEALQKGQSDPLVVHHKALDCLMEVRAYKEGQDSFRVLLRARGNPMGLFEAAPYAVLLVDGDACIWDINQTACEFWGVEKETVLGQLCGSLLRCINASRGLGCGKNISCTHCTVRRSVGETLEKSCTIKNREATITLHEQPVPLRHVLLSTTLTREYDQEMVFLTVIDITERKQIEDQLAKSEIKYRSLVEDMKDIVYSLSPAGVFSYVSPRWTLSLGYETERILGQGFRELASLVHPDDRISFMEYMRQCDQEIEGSLGELEFRIEDIRGQFLWYATSLSPQWDKKGRLLAYQGVARDITKRKVTEEELRRKTEELERYFSSSLDLLCIISTEGVFLRLNQEWEKVLGYPLSVLRGKSFLDLVHPEDVRITKKAIWNLSTLDSIRNFENRLVCLDGSSRWIEWRAVMVDGVIHGVARDVTERKAMEQELKESEERFRILVNHSYDLIWRLSPQGIISYISPAWKRVLGYEPADVVGKLSSCLVHPADVETCSDYIRAVAKARVALPGITYEVLHADSSWKWHEGTITPVYDAEGALMYFVGISRDITERKQVEENLLQYTQELEAREMELDALYQALDLEMRNARRAHQVLIQQELPSLEGLSLVAVNHPATYIGGDFASAIRVKDKLILYLADITGHGLEGTIFSLFVKGCIESYSNLVPENEITPHRILQYLSEQVQKGSYPSEYAVAIFVLVISIPTREIAYSAAGFQNPPILLREDGSFDFLASPGLPISPDIPPELLDFASRSEVFPPHALLFLATDGIYEQSTEEGMYEERLLTVLQSCAGLPVSFVSERISKDFHEFLGDRKQEDDVTFVVVSMKEEPLESMS